MCCTLENNLEPCLTNNSVLRGYANVGKTTFDPKLITTVQPT